MPVPVVMPALGMAQEEGTLVRWLCRPGEAVERGQPLMEVETDKATVEIEAPASGRLGRPLVVEGEAVPVGQVIAHILGPGEADPAPTSGHPLVAASPRARRLAAERGIDLGAVAGSGPGGAVLAADLPEPVAEPLPSEGRIRRLVAERTAAAWRAPHFFLTRDADAGRLQSWLQALRGVGITATHTDLLVVTVAAALRRHPVMNATWRDGPVHHGEVNLAIAVDTPQGLIAPVLHRVDGLGVGEVVDRRRTLVERARLGRLAPADLEGGTFTVSNLGMLGVDAFTAILNGGQAGILAVGRILNAVVAVEGRPEVRPRMTLTLSCDHRMVDGSQAARFLADLVRLVEEPLALFATSPPSDASTNGG
jgi:pyruvate dehydrogenase E2 component (dihydrolipoamide acetyltransferase)